MRGFLVAALILFSAFTAKAEDGLTGIRGSPEAIAKAQGMVEAMGGLYIWKELKTLYFEHRWFHLEAKDIILETEVIALTESASYFKMESEVYFQARAYTPTAGWRLRFNEFTRTTDEEAKANAHRARFNLYRIARGIAVGDPFFEVRLGEGGRLDFYDSEGTFHTWVKLNGWNEPVVWWTEDFRYTFGPMESYGNIRVPAWAVYDEAIWRYEMVSLTGSRDEPDPDVFLPPEPYRE